MVYDEAQRGLGNVLCHTENVAGFADGRYVPIFGPLKGKQGTDSRSGKASNVDMPKHIKASK
jgi:hypothetical protein